MKHWAKMGKILFQEKLKYFSIVKFLMHVNGMMIIFFFFICTFKILQSSISMQKCNFVERIFRLFTFHVKGTIMNFKNKYRIPLKKCKKFGY